jgi:hypothetical protein
MDRCAVLMGSISEYTYSLSIHLVLLLSIAVILFVSKLAAKEADIYLSPSRCQLRPCT